MSTPRTLFIDEMPQFSATYQGEVFSQRYEHGAMLVTSNLPFDESISVLGSERLTGALLDRLTYHVYILAMNGESYRLATSKKRQQRNTKTNAATEKGEEKS